MKRAREEWTHVENIYNGSHHSGMKLKCRMGARVHFSTGMYRPRTGRFDAFCDWAEMVGAKITENQGCVAKISIRRVLSQRKLVLWFSRR